MPQGDPHCRPSCRLNVRCVSDRYLAKDRDIAHILLQVQGESRLVGMDNGDPLSHQSFKGSQIAAFQGQYLALIQAETRVGKYPCALHLQDVIQLQLC